MHIIQAIQDPQIFKPLFPDLRSWSVWFVVLKAIFALPMSKSELKIFRKFTGRRSAPRIPFLEVFLIIGRRGGKSFISALILVYLAVFRHWNLGIEKGYILCIAGDKKQASVVLNYVKQILQLPAFRALVVAPRAEEIELSNGMIISVKTCSYRSLRGYSICAVVLDELAFWRHEGSNPSGEVLTAIGPSLGGVEGSLLLAISTGYSQTGPLYEAFRDRYGKEDPECLVWRAGTADMNPLYSNAVIDRALKEDFAAARAEYFGEFRQDLETFLSTELIEAAVVNDRYELPRVRGFSYFGFVDPSGGRGDSMTLSICHREEMRIIQDCIRAKFPPFDPGVCVEEFSKVLKSYGIHTCEGDRYSGAWCSSAFQNEGIHYRSTPLSKSDLYLESLSIFMTGRLELLDNKQQANELRQLERRTGKQRDSVDHPRGLHDDIANACAGACVLAARVDSWRLPPPSYDTEPVESDVQKMEREAVDWLNPQNKKKKKKEEIEDPDLDPKRWDISAMGLSEIDKELAKMEKEENE